MVEEGSEDEESDGEENDHTTAIRPRPNVVPPRSFSPSEVAQAFSHFSYWATGRKRLICDLQGEYDKDANVLKLSDPVIHYFDHRREHRRHVHGRTDLGRRGEEESPYSLPRTSVQNSVTSSQGASKESP
jgi:hypothetical protein